MTLIVRREGDALRRYAHIGTGNYHAATARLYEDFGIFTADEEITADVADLFNYITGFGRPQRFRKLLVAPFTLRSGLVDEIRARRGRGGDGQARAHPAQAQPPRRPEDRRGALRGLAGRRARSTSSRARRARCAPAWRGSRRTSTSARSSGASSSTAGSTRSRRATRSTTYIGSPDLMQRNLDHRIEVLDAGRERARAAGGCTRSSTARSPTTTNAWVLGARRASGRASRPQSRRSRTPTTTTMMRRALKRARRGARDRRGG